MDSWKQRIAEKEIVFAEKALYNSTASHHSRYSAPPNNFNGQNLRLLEFMISLSYLIYNGVLKTYEYFGGFHIMACVLCFLVIILHFDYFEKKFSPLTIFSIEFWFNILSFFFWLLCTIGFECSKLPRNAIYQVNLFMSIFLTILFFSSLGISYGDFEAYSKRRNKIERRKKRFLDFFG